MTMETIFYPEESRWEELCARPRTDTSALEAVCREIFDQVRTEGDAALRRYTERFDRVKVSDLAVSAEEFDRAQELVPPSLQQAIRTARENIEGFHLREVPRSLRWKSPQGVVCRQQARPIRRVGIYVPGGSAPLFSTVLMLAVPAAIAGCPEVVMCTPPGKDGRVNPAVLWTARLCGVEKVFRVGGIQAIAGMTFGTESIPAVYKLFGPGNGYVMAAKQLAQRFGVAIDMPAGPSEVLVVADGGARADFVAADLLSQAEHGPDSQVVLLTDRKDFPERVLAELERQLAELPRRDIAEKALSHSRIIVLESIEHCLEFSNAYAPEHLILSVRQSEKYARAVENAGSVFLGNYSPESAGDYASGTNHTLPTSAYARAYSGVNVDAFVKKITFQKVTPSALQALGPVIQAMAQAEQTRCAQPGGNDTTKCLEEMSFPLEHLVRPNIRALEPYSCARDEYEGDQALFLDANENPFDTGLNRYPDPHQRALKKALSALKGVPVERMVLGNGSDEIIDIVIRSLCRPGQDNIVVFSPGYSMYEVAAHINEVEVRRLDLTPDFQPDWQGAELFGCLHQGGVRGQSQQSGGYARSAGGHRSVLRPFSGFRGGGRGVCRFFK